MRTTLDIEDHVLALARTRAREKGISLGEEVSELMRRSLTSVVTASPVGFPVFQPPPGAPVVTDELVAQFRDENG